MARKKTGTNDVEWGFNGPRDRTFDEFASLAKATKLRTLLDMSEREIRALERFYGCPVQRPDRPKRARRATGGAVQAGSLGLPGWSRGGSRERSLPGSDLREPPAA